MAKPNTLEQSSCLRPAPCVFTRVRVASPFEDGVSEKANFLCVYDRDPRYRDPRIGTHNRRF